MLSVAQLYGLPHGILGVFNTILYENKFQNPQIFYQTISLFPEQSTLYRPIIQGQYNITYRILPVFVLSAFMKPHP
jgi:hypothetical protein